MTTQNNENVNQNQIAAETASFNQVQQYNPQVVQGLDGKFKRKAQYNDYCSFTPETKAEKVWLVNIMNGSDETVIPLKNHVKKNIVVKNVMTSVYDKVDEDTGEIQFGVVTTLFDVDGSIYVTSSKSVYFTLQNIFKVFGYPNTEGYEALEFQVFEERKGKSPNKSVDLKLIG